jgi:hypothetical protein
MTHIGAPFAPDSDGSGGDAGRRDERPGRHPDELERLRTLTAALRGVNRALVSSTTREGLATAVCERLADSGRFRAVCMADRPTWVGNADRWTVAAASADEPPSPPMRDDDDCEHAGAVTDSPTVVAAGDWTVVSVNYSGTVSGALGVLPADPNLAGRERAVLTELGEVIGHAIHAIETRRLVSDRASIELELRHPDERDALVDAAARADCRFSLDGVVPVDDETSVAYLRVADAPGDAAAGALAAASTGDGDVRTVRTSTDGDGGVLEWTVAGDSLLAWLGDHGAAVTDVTADDAAATYTVEMPADTEVRTLLDRVEHAFPATWLAAKRELDRPVEPAGEITESDLDELTDRQQEAMEVAFRAGYYQWPRESTATEVAETIGIAPPTLHAHLRKAEQSLLGELFDADARPRRSDAR